MGITGPDTRMDREAHVKKLIEQMDMEAHVTKLLELKKLWPSREKRNFLAEAAATMRHRTPEEQREWEERHPGFMSSSEGASLRYWRESEN